MITATPGPIEAVRQYSARELTASQRGQLYFDSIKPALDKGHPILASNSLGTMSGNLVVQRALDVLADQIPVLSRIASDYSDQGGYMGQQMLVKVPVPPVATAYSTTTGYAVSDAETDDIPVTINAHKSITIGFNANEMASSGRKLFDEQVQAVMVGLGDDLAAALFGVITAGNFAEAVIAPAASFDRVKVIEIAEEITTRKVPLRDRFLLLNPALFYTLCRDAAVTMLGIQQRPGIITAGDLPEIAGFTPILVSSLPTSENLVGFAGHKSALAIAVRPAGDYASIFGPMPGSGTVSQVVDPRTGLSVTTTQYVDHSKGAAYMRVAWIYGVAKGHATRGTRLVSAW